MRISTGYFITLLIAICCHVTASAQTWRQVGRVPHRKYDDQVNAIFFVDDNHGWASTAGGSISRSNDGGESWEKIRDDVSLGEIYGIKFIDPQVGFYPTHSVDTTRLWKTTDGGTSWRVVFANYSTPSYKAYEIGALSVADPKVIYAC
ncbi:MAG: hypothetical protein ABI876_07635, partial [Bacteroidota bacterium]